MRIDKFLWVVRLSKTRSQASKLCDSDKVKLNGEIVKASKTVKPKDQINLRDLPIWRSYKVLDFPKSRVGAKLVPDYLEETTSKEDIAQWKQVQETNRQNRIDGFRGRPTKKDRRKLDGFKY